VETVFVALRVLLSLAAVVGAIWLLQRRLTRGKRPSRSGKLMTVVTRQVIAPKASVVVLDMDGKRFLLGVTEQSVTVLNAGDAPVEQLEPATVPQPKSPRAKAAAAQLVAEPGAAAGPDSGAAFGEALAKAGAPDSGTRNAGAGNATVDFPRIDPRTGQFRGGGALDGSILSPTTWKRAAAALRQHR
jgi:flagellar protein FliO/FliZ